MSSFTKTFPPGTLVIRTDLTVTSIVSKKPGEKIVCDAIWDTGANASAISLNTRGLGGNSCGPRPLARDIIDTSKDYRLDFAILPRKVLTALSLKDEAKPLSDRVEGHN